MKIRIGGDLGDACYALSVIRQIPDAPHEIFFVDQEGRCTRDFTNRTHLLIPLFEKQPYIKSAKNSKAPADIDFTEFRNFHGATITLPQAQAIHVGVQSGIIVDDHGTTPWLTVKTPMKSRSGIVISHTDRYNNPTFPWAKIVQHYGWSRLTFVGLPEEHIRFCKEFGPVSHQPVKNFWELAQLIMQSNLFIGNQSSPMSLAVGMGHPFIQEVNEDQPDCIFARDNAQYVIDGSCVLPDIDDSGEHAISAPQKDVSHYNRSLIPSGYWQYPSLPACADFHIQKNLVAQLESCSTERADDKLMRFNINRVPDFFMERGSNPLEKYHIAYQKAFGHKPKPIQK